jgi:hypothetical protein
MGSSRLEGHRAIALWIDRSPNAAWPRRHGPTESHRDDPAAGSRKRYETVCRPPATAVVHGRRPACRRSHSRLGPSQADDRVGEYPMARISHARHRRLVRAPGAALHMQSVSPRCVSRRPAFGEMGPSCTSPAGRAAANCQGRSPLPLLRRSRIDPAVAGGRVNLSERSELDSGTRRSPAVSAAQVGGSAGSPALRGGR